MKTLSPLAALWSLFVLAIGTACGGGGLEKEEFCEEYARAYCARSEACCEGASDAAECEDDFGTFCRFGLAGVDDDDYDAEAAEDCVAEIDASKDSCDPNAGSGPDSACERVAPSDDDDPKEGESCEGFCAEGLYCDFDDDTCKRESPVGGSCAEDTFSCADGSRCNTTTDVCEAEKAGGEPCQANGECASFTCQEDKTCAPEEPSYCALNFG